MTILKSLFSFGEKSNKHEKIQDVFRKKDEDTFQNYHGCQVILFVVTVVKLQMPTQESELLQTVWQMGKSITELLQTVWQMGENFLNYDKLDDFCLKDY